VRRNPFAAARVAHAVARALARDPLEEVCRLLGIGQQLATGGGVSLPSWRKDAVAG